MPETPKPPAAAAPADTDDHRDAAGGWRAETRLVHVGSEPDPRTGAVVPPISLATTFAQDGIGALKGRGDPNSYGRGYDYSRSGNPTRGALERNIAAAEVGAVAAVAFSSGLAAIHAVISLLSSGDEVLCIDDVYGGAQRLFRRVALPAAGIRFRFMSMVDVDAVRDAIRRPPTDGGGGGGTRLLWIESPTNPNLQVCDIAAVAAVAREAGVLLCVDNTFMSPYFQNPLQLGAQLVVHSATKYIGGHSDVVMGVVATSDPDLARRLRFLQSSIGAVPSPFDCYLALRGMKTLHVRMEAAGRNAQRVAEMLEQHPRVRKVAFPGLPSHPQHALQRRQARGFGAMVTFFVKGGLEAARVFLSSLRVFALAESLGAVESLAESPALMTHASVPPEQLRALGIDGSLIRLSVGIEHIDDILADLRAALDASATVPRLAPRAGAEGHASNSGRTPTAAAGGTALKAAL